MLENPPRRSWKRVIFGALLIAVFTAMTTTVPVLQRVLGTHGWEKIPCTLLGFGIADHPDARHLFSAEVSFQYQAGGKTWIGTHLWALQDSDDYTEIDNIRRTMLAGSGDRPVAASCWVNPVDPAQAFLISPAADSPCGPKAGTIIGVIVVIPGVLLIVRGLTGRSLRSRLFTNNPPDGPNFHVGLLFLILALAFLVVAIRQTFEWHRMRKWVLAPAQVLWSKVTPRQSSSPKGSYSVAVFYRYRYDGAEYHSSRYDGFATSWGGNAKLSDFVSKELPGGRTLGVFVDPAAPHSAVIDRGPGGIVPFYGLFLVCGAVGLAAMKRPGRRRGKAHAQELQKPMPPSIRSFPAEESWAISAKAHEADMGEKWLMVSGEWHHFGHQRIRILSFLPVFSVGFNLLVWAVVLPSWREIVGPSYGSPSGSTWFRLMVGLPLALSGLAVAVAAIHGMLRKGGPVFKVKLDRADLIPGSSTQIHWRRVDHDESPKAFLLSLVGEAWNGETQQEQTFCDETIFQTAKVSEMRSGQAELIIPADAVPSLQIGEMRSIEWRIELTLCRSENESFSSSSAINVRFPTAAERLP